QLCVNLVFEHERQRDAKANLHLAQIRWNGEALDQNAVAPGSCDEDRIAPLLNRNFLISLSDLPASCKRSFTFLAVYPQRQSRHDTTRRQLHLSSRFSLHIRIVSKDERPLDVAHASVGI